MQRCWGTSVSAQVLRLFAWPPSRLPDSWTCHCEPSVVLADSSTPLLGWDSSRDLPRILLGCFPPAGLEMGELVSPLCNRIFRSDGAGGSWWVEQRGKGVMIFGVHVVPVPSWVLVVPLKTPQERAGLLSEQKKATLGRCCHVAATP